MPPRLRMDADDDLDVLWCDDCCTSHGLNCPKLGSTIKIQDRQVETRVLATLPESLHVNVIDGSRQVVAAAPISRRTQFGPLEARRLDGNWSGDQIVYKIFANRSVVASLDISDDDCCNWMSLVPLNSDPLHQNLVSVQYEGHIYFLASRNIKDGEKLCVWYSPNYAAKMAAASTSNKIEISSKNVTTVKLSTNVGMVSKEVWPSARELQNELQASSISPGQDTSSSSAIEETHLRGNRRVEEEEDGNHSGEEDDDYIHATNTDGSSDEEITSTFSASFLQSVSSATSEARVEVLKVKESSANKDHITSLAKKESPAVTSESSLHDKEYYKGTLSPQSVQETKSSLCQLQHSGPETFINHMVEVHGLSSTNQSQSCFRYSCHLCTTVLPSPGLLQDHMTTQHKGHMIDPLKCCKCSKVLQNFAELQQHELRHSSLLSVVCHVCGERFLKGAMDGHLKERHTAMDGYVCLQCGHTSTSLMDITRHFRWHDGLNQGAKEKQETARDEDSYDKGGGCPLEAVIRVVTKDEEKSGDFKIERRSDRMPLIGSRSVTTGDDDSMSVRGEGGSCIDGEGQRKKRGRKCKLEKKERKLKRRKVSLEDGSSKTFGEDESKGGDLEMSSLGDKRDKMFAEVDSRQDDDEVKNLDIKGDGQNNFLIPMRRYNLRHRGYQTYLADQESSLVEGIDESDHEQTLYNCHICESEFQSKQKLDNHLGVHLHRRSKISLSDLHQYPCTECGSVFFSSRSLVLHRANSHKDVKEECQHCDYRCVAMVTLKEHILSKHKEVDLGIPKQFQYPCQNCDLVFLKFFRLTKHMQTHLTKQFKCEKCCHFFSRKDGLQYHKCNPSTLDPGISIHLQKASVYKCKYCQKEFDKVKVLNIHVFTHFINVPSKSGTFVLFRVPTKADKVLTCPHCHGHYDTPTLLVQHVARAHQKKIYVCSLCFSILDSHESLLSHMQNHIETDSDKCEPQSILGNVSTCEDCFAVFPNESTLQRHKAVHLKTKDFICDICGKMFSRKDTLGNHLKSHSSSKPHQCEICGKYLKTPRSLQIHVNTHLEERKFQCPVCLRGFKQKGNLNKHMSRCVPRRDIQCKYCSLKFRDLTAVASHEQHIHSSQQRADFMY